MTTGKACALAVFYFACWFWPKAAIEAILKEPDRAKVSFAQWLLAALAITLVYLLSLLLNADA